MHVFSESLEAANVIDTFSIFKTIPIEIIKEVKRIRENRDEIFERKFRQQVSAFSKNTMRFTIDVMLKSFDGFLKEQFRHG